MYRLILLQCSMRFATVHNKRAASRMQQDVRPFPVEIKSADRKRQIISH